MARVLSLDEQERADGYCFDLHRSRFIVGRSMLRTIIGQYLGLDPSDIQFSHGRNGKPALACKQDADRIQFNVAHSHEIVLYALTSHGTVGVDVELVRQIPNAEAISQRIFSVAEYSRFCEIPPYQRTEAFFNGWTRKEAYVKAIGDGLSMALDRIEVSLVPGEPAGLLYLDGDPVKASLRCSKPMTKSSA